MKNDFMDYKNSLAHSRGKWKKHLYTAIVNGKYVYGNNATNTDLATNTDKSTDTDLNDTQKSYKIIMSKAKNAVSDAKEKYKVVKKKASEIYDREVNGVSKADKEAAKEAAESKLAKTKSDYENALNARNNNSDNYKNSTKKTIGGSSISKRLDSAKKYNELQKSEHDLNTKRRQYDYAVEDAYNADKKQVSKTKTAAQEIKKTASSAANTVKSAANTVKNVPNVIKREINGVTQQEKTSKVNATKTKAADTQKNYDKAVKKYKNANEALSSSPAYRTEKETAAKSSLSDARTAQRLRDEAAKDYSEAKNLEVSKTKTAAKNAIDYLKKKTKKK